MPAVSLALGPSMNQDKSIRIKSFESYESNESDGQRGHITSAVVGADINQEQCVNVFWVQIQKTQLQRRHGEE